MFWGEFIQDVSKRKNRTSESEVRFRLKPSYTPSRQNPYHLNPLPRRLGKINHRFKTRYFFLWNIYVRVFAPSTKTTMPSLSEGNLDLKIGYLDQGAPPKPEISGLYTKSLKPARKAPHARVGTLAEQPPAGEKV